MRNSLCILAAALGFCLPLVAQTVTPPVNGDSPRILWSQNIPENTGLSIAPGSDLHASVYDSFNSYFLEIYDRFGTSLDFHTYDGADPDVAFSRDQHRIYVTYQLNGRIWLDVYDDSGNPPGVYNFISNQVIAAGSSPNIDINSSGHGAITWEFDQSVYACAIDFNNGSVTVYPVTAVHPDAKQPDIAVLDYPYPLNTPPDEMMLTCVTSDGLLVIMDLSYPLLQNGVLAGNQFQGFTWYYTPTTASYEHPRISSLHQQNYAAIGSYKHWTVVAQDCAGSGSAVKAIFHYHNGTAWVMTAPTVVNSYFSQCPADPWPVVAYERSEVHIAWSQRYVSGCASQVNFTGLGQDVLMINYSHDGMALGANFSEINEQQVGFHQSRSAIATIYDGASPVYNNTYIEGMFYHNAEDPFSKSVYNGNPVYKTEATTELEKASSIRLLTNPVAQVITVETDGEQQYDFALVDLLGKIHPLTPTSSTGTKQSFDASNLANGLYILQHRSGLETGAMQVVVKH